MYEELREKKNIDFSRPIIFYLVIPQDERTMYIDFDNEVLKPYYQQDPERVTFWDAVYSGNKSSSFHMRNRLGVVGCPIRAKMYQGENDLRYAYDLYVRLWMGMEKVEKPNYAMLRKALKETRKNQGILISLHKNFKETYFALHVDDRWDLQENEALTDHEQKFKLNSLLEHSINIKHPFISAPLFIKKFEGDEQIPQIEGIVRDFYTVLERKING